jgi:hypothetical protein
MVAPFKQILLIGALLYILSPVDLIPDVLWGLGWLDDLLVLGLLLWVLSGLRKHRGGPFRWWRGTWPRRAEPQDPYIILGVERHATEEEIRAAYRRAVAQYHPDKVSHLGQELQELAHQKLIAIQQAYDELMGRRDGH